MARTFASVPNVVLGLVVIGAVAALAWAGTSSRAMFEDAGRFFPIDRYEAAARLDRLGANDGPEIRIWVKQHASSEAAAIGHVIRPTGMASFWLMRGQGDAIGAVTSTIDRDTHVREAFAPLLSDLRTLEGMSDACGWDAPDYEIEAVTEGERLHFRFDRACADRIGAFRRVVELVGG